MSQLPTIPGDTCALRKTPSDYQREHRLRTEGKTCDCGKQAHRFKVDGFVCPQCDELEVTQIKEYMRRFKSLDELSEKTKRKFIRKSNTELMAEKDRGEGGFISTLKEIGNEIVVFAHGEYHLRMTAT